MRPHPLKSCSGILCAALLLAALPAVGEVDAASRACAQQIATLLSSGNTAPVVDGVPILAARLLREIYAAQDYAPLWHAGTEQALTDAVRASLDDGLTPGDYPLPSAAGAKLASPLDCAHREVLLGESLLRLAYSLRFGRTDPRRISRRWNYPRTLAGTRIRTWVQQSLQGDTLAAALSALRPAGPYYADLRKELVRLRALSGDWAALAPGKTLRIAMRGTAVAALRVRLQAAQEGSAEEASDPLLFDAPLEARIRSFQTRHGLRVDGAVGPRTRAALNVSRAARIDQVRVNLERMRWVAHDLPPRFFAVNIAAFEAGLLEDGRVRWRARTIVGRPWRQTPVFRATITALEFNPDWTVPPGILRADVLPALRRDPGYLTAHGLEVMNGNGQRVDPATIDWQSVPEAGSPYLFRQPPGPDNALGRVKFIFPNPWSVYLHDTPARDLFAQESRPFSSGCIRLDRPLELAERLLAGDPHWTVDRINTVLAEGTTARVPLLRPLPILLLYLTAWGGEPQGVMYRPDIYARDDAVREALAAPFRFDPPEDPEAPEAPG